MRWIHGFLLIATACHASAQAQLAFEVASIKPSLPIDRGFRTRISGGPGAADPERFSGEGLSLGALLNLAYGVEHYQLSAPGWVDEETFDIVVKVPKGHPMRGRRCLRPCRSNWG